MSLRGNLNSVDLANIFQMLSINQKEGTLNIFDGESKKSIYFSQDGVSMLSRGKVKKDTLGRILLRYDKLTEEELERALQLQRQTGKLLGVILAEGGLVPREVVEDALRIQIEEEIYNLFIWKDASFEFIEGIPPREFEEMDGAITRLTFNVNSLIMEAARRIDEWEHIQKLICSMNEIFRYSGRNMELTDDIFREPYCEKVLAAINGKNNVDEIVDLSYVNKFEVCKILSLLLEQEAIEPITVADLAEVARASIDAGDVKEGIKFLGRIIELRGETPETHEQLGRAYEQLREIAKAAHHYRTFAEYRMTAGGVEDAFSVYRRICEMIPTDLQSADRLVEIFTSHPDRLGDFSEEVVDRGKTLATIYLELKKNARAIQTLHRVIGLAPEDFSLRNLLINIYLANGMSSEAIAEYEAMADWYYRKKDWDQVIKIFRKILVIDRSREDLNHRLEQLITRKERKQRGRKRLILTVVIVIGIAALGFVYFQYEMKARQDIAEAEARAAKEVAQITESTKAVTAELERLRKELTKGDVNAAELISTYREAQERCGAYRTKIQGFIRDLERVADEYRFSTVRTQAINKQQELSLLQQKFEQLIKNAGVQIQTKAVQLVTEAEELLKVGEVTKALDRFEKAKLLAIDERVLRENRVDENIDDLREALDSFRERMAEIDEAVQVGDFARARAIGAELLEHFFYQSEFRDQIVLPIQVQSWPKGGKILADDRDTGKVTPDWVLYHPTKGVEISIALEGYSTSVDTIPAIDKENQTRALSSVREHQEVDRTLVKKVLWAPRLEGGVQAELTVQNGKLYAATRQSRIFQLDPRNRTLEETFHARDINGFGAGPVATRTDLFVCTIRGPVQRIALADGKPLWSKEVHGMVYAPLTLAGDVLLVGDRSGFLTAYDVSDGHERWRRRVTGEIRGRPVVAKDKVYVTSTEGALHVFDLARGDDVAKPIVPPGDRQRLEAAPLVQDDLVFVASTNKMLYAFRIGTWQLAWSFDVGAEIRCAPVPMDGAVLVAGMDGRVSAIRNGRLLDSFEVGCPVRCSPTVNGKDVFVCGDAGKVVGAEFANDRFLVHWKYDLEGDDGLTRVSVPAIVVDDRVVVAAESGELFVLSE